MWNDIFSIILIEAFKGQVDWLKKIEKRLQGFFLWIWFNWLKATKPLQGGSLFLTTKVCHTCEGHNLHNTEALWLLRKLLFFNWSLTGSPPPKKKKKKEKKKQMRDECFLIIYQSQISCITLDEIEWNYVFFHHISIWNSVHIWKNKYILLQRNYSGLQNSKCNLVTPL